MGKALVIRDANFSSNAIYSRGSYIYVNNTFTWGKGGISTPGTSSGSTNPVMSMVGLPLELAEENLFFVAANGYKIYAILTSNYPSPATASQYTYTMYSTPIDSITVPSGKYYQICVTRPDSQNANINDGPSALLLRQEA